LQIKESRIESVKSFCVVTALSFEGMSIEQCWSNIYEHRMSVLPGSKQCCRPFYTTVQYSTYLYVQTPDFAYICYNIPESDHFAKR
jgi:hypothetical protein